MDTGAAVSFMEEDTGAAVSFMAESTQEKWQPEAVLEPSR